MALLAAAGLFLLVKGRFDRYRWLLWGLVGAIALPYIGNTAGWIMAEMGRQPWLVFGLLKTTAGVSPGVTWQMILFSLSAFVVLYTVLTAIEVTLMLRYAGQDVSEVIAEKKSSTDTGELVAHY